MKNNFLFQYIIQLNNNKYKILLTISAKLVKLVLVKFHLQ